MLMTVDVVGKIHTPDHYEYAIRQCFREERWEAGKYMLDEARPYYGTMSPFLELDGWYLYHIKDYDQARRYLHNALEEDASNTHARELIMNVERETENYSSAICYINELLENNAYSKDLWKKKIDLYRTINNDVEADKLLDRLYLIYPADSAIVKDAAYRYEQRLISGKQNGDIGEQIRCAEQLIELQPNNPDNYLILSNLYLQSGQEDRALQIAMRGSAKFNDPALVKKYAGIQCSRGQHQLAMAFIKDLPKTSYNTRLINEIQEDHARYVNANDPYTAYGKIYERTHNKESFNYLINTSISRGYYNDALYYVKDYTKRYPETEDIYYKEYVIYKQLGNETQARYSLRKLYEYNPNDEDICNELCEMYYKTASEYMALGEYAQAIPMLEFIAKECTDDELVAPSFSKMATCYTMLQEYEDAIASLDISDPRYKEKYADLLVLKGDLEEALIVIHESRDSVLYAEITMKYAKYLMDERKWDEALIHIDKALDRITDKELLQMAVSCAHITGKYTDVYIYKGIEKYPYDDYFISQYCGLMNDIGLDERKNKNYEDAMMHVDMGLDKNPNHKELLYTKGLIYESMHMYDSAYIYQKNYSPGQFEKFEFSQKMSSFMQKSLPNTLTITYEKARPSKQDAMTAIAGIDYTRKLNSHNAIEFFMDYTGREDDPETRMVPGGVGVRVGAGYELFTNNDWTIAVEAAWANKYFPEISAKVEISKEFESGVTASLRGQYRKLDSYEKIDSTWRHSQPNMLSFDAGVGYNFENGFGITSSANAIFIKDNIYYTFDTKMTYNPVPSSRTGVWVSGGFGTSPELELIENNLPSSFEGLNTHVGMGGTYMLNPHLDVGLAGSWSNMYSKSDINTSYFNLFYIDANITIHF